MYKRTSLAYRILMRQYHTVYARPFGGRDYDKDDLSVGPTHESLFVSAQF